MVITSCFIKWNDSIRWPHLHILMKAELNWSVFTFEFKYVTDFQRVQSYSMLQLPFQAFFLFKIKVYFFFFDIKYH